MCIICDTRKNLETRVTFIAAFIVTVVILLHDFYNFIYKDVEIVC